MKGNTLSVKVVNEQKCTLRLTGTDAPNQYFTIPNLAFQ